MTSAWVCIGLVAILAVVLLVRDHLWARELDNVRADLDELAGDHHTPAERLKDLTDRVTAVEVEITGDQPSTGRHAHTGEHPTTPIGGPR